MLSRIILQDIKRTVISIRKEAKALEGKKLLISGGAGFIGAYLVGAVDYLNRFSFKKPCKVVSVDNYITGQRREFSKNITQLEHDVTRPLKIKEKIDYIIHAAGIASPIYYKKYPLETIEATISGVKNLLELARRQDVASFLFFSSSEIYGDPDPAFIPTPETYNGNVSSIGPRSCYDESKRLGETLCMVYFDLFKVPVKIVRPFNVFGPGMKPDDYRVVPVFLTKAIRGEMLPVHDQGHQTRTFCYISDAAAGFFKVLLSDKNGEVYNVGNDENEIDMMSLAKIVGQLFKNKIEIKAVSYPDSYPKQEPHRRCPDLTKIRTQLDYHPKVNLKTGLTRTLKWYREVLES